MKAKKVISFNRLPGNSVDGAIFPLGLDRARFPNQRAYDSGGPIAGQPALFPAFRFQLRAALLSPACPTRYNRPTVSLDIRPVPKSDLDRFHFLVSSAFSSARGPEARA